MLDYVIPEHKLKPSRLKKLAMSVILLQLFVFMFLQVSCTHQIPATTEIQGYELYVFEQGFAHFSFEKPRYYYTSESFIGVQDDYEWIYFLRNSNLLSNLTRQQSLTVDVRKISVEHPSVSAEIETGIAMRKGQYPDFVLLERSMVSVGGISAEQIVWSGGINSSSVRLPAPFSCSLFPVMLENVREKYTTFVLPTHVRDVYFEYGGLIWIIQVTSSPIQNEVDQAKADFEHVLQTFKILD